VTDYLVYDVFTDRPFGGNPLAVIPDASTLPEDRLQPIAREFGFSETVFVLPGNPPRLRIFTPTQEIPFAGHPLIGTATALRDLGHPAEMTLMTGVGPIPATVAQDARFTRKTTLEILHQPDTDLVAACLSLPRDRIAGATIASAGLPFVLAEITDRDALATARPETGAFRQGQDRYPLPFDFAVYAYVRDGETIHARMFAPLDDIPEDPATGSAAAALALFLAGDGPLSLMIHQGEDMGRPSRIGADVADGAVTIAGRAVKVMEGRLTLGWGLAVPAALG